MSVGATMSLVILGVDRASGVLDKVGAKAATSQAKMKAVSAGVSMAGLAVVGLGAAAIDSAVHFEKSITLLQTAAGESGKNLKMVGDGVLDISNKTGVASGHLAEGMYIVEKAGFRGAAGLQVLKVAAEAAVSEGVDMATMTTALTSVMTSYHLKAKDAANITSQMDRAAGLSKTTFGDFASSLSTVLPIASAAGISFAQVGGAIATLTSHGTTSAEATQELNATIRALQAPNQVAQKEMNQLGINVQDLTSNLGKRGLTGTLDIVMNSLAKTGPGGRILLDSFKKSGAAGRDMQVMLSKMPPAVAALAKSYQDGTISQKAYTSSARKLPAEQFAMARQFGALKLASSGFNEVLKAGSPATQSATDALKKMMGGSIGLNTALMLGGPNMDAFKANVAQIGSQAGTAGGDIKTFGETSSTAAFKLGTTAAQIHTLGIRIGQDLLPVLKTVLTWLTKVFTWIAAHKSTVEHLGAGILIVAAAMKVLSITTAALNLIMDANPIVLLVVALAALAAGVIYAWNHFKGFRDFITGAWAVIKQVAVDIATAFKAMVSAVGSAFGNIGTFFSNLWGDISHWVGALFGNLVRFGSRVIASIVSGISGAWHNIAKWFTGLWGGITHWVGNIFGSLLRWGGDLIGHIVSGISSAWHGIGAWFTGLWGNISGWVSGVFGSALTWGANLIGYISSGIRAAWQQIKSWFTGLWGNISGWVSGVFGKALTWGASLIGYISAGISAAWHGLSSFFSNLWSNITGAIGDIASAAWNLGHKIISGIWDGIRSIAGNVWDFITGGSNTHNITLTTSPISGGGTFGTPAPPPSVAGGRKFLATGGQVADGWATVGEAGPELVHKSGANVRVFSNEQSKRKMAGAPAVGAAFSGSQQAGTSSGGGGVTELHVHINGGTIIGTADQVAVKMYDLLAAAQRRGILTKRMQLGL